MTQTITRSDGIVYERKNKTKNYDTTIQLRLATNYVEKLKQFAKENNLKYTTIVRELIEEFVERECE